MNLLFWNLAKKSNEKIIKDLIEENGIGIAIFSEYAGVDFPSLLLLLNNQYISHPGFGGCEKITLLAHKSIEVVVRREQNRYTIYHCKNDGTQYIIAGIHLSANPHADAELRKNEIRDIVKDIEEVESHLKCNNTIVIGDFNASPFDAELIQKDAFNAVLFKNLIRTSEFCKISRKRYKRFYNPMLHYISENTCSYGSYYYSSGISTLYWYCYDQVVVRKPLVDKILDLKYCRSTKNRSLIATKVPNKAISDHLP